MAKFSIFKRKNKTKPLRNKEFSKRVHKYEPNSYSHLREGVKKEKKILDKKLKVTKKTLSKTAKKRILMFVCLFIFLPAFYFFFTKSNVFEVKVINITTADPTITEAINKKYLGANIFSFRNDEIEELIKSSFAYIDTIYVKKEYPDKIFIEVINQVPIGLVIEPERVVYVDDSYNALNIVAWNGITSFNEFELNILMGIQDLDNDKIREEYKKTLVTQEEKDSFKWDEVPAEVKAGIFGPIANAVNGRLSEIYAKSMEKSSTVGFSPEFLVIYLNKSESVLYEDFDPRGKTAFAREIVKILKTKNIDFFVPTWISPTTLRIDLKNESKVFYFTTERQNSERSYEDQLRDLHAVINNNKLVEGRIFDFRTVNYAIIR